VSVKKAAKAALAIGALKKADFVEEIKVIIPFCGSSKKR
tara:strand:+ start:552 stop:668 length:117 start_codon:yes stop_codon:yes gene_type:complete